MKMNPQGPTAGQLIRLVNDRTFGPPDTGGSEPSPSQRAAATDWAKKTVGPLVLKSVSLDTTKFREEP